MYKESFVKVSRTNTILRVQIGLIEDKFVVNPKATNMENSKLYLLLTFEDLI